MNRLHLRLSNLPLLAIVLFLAFASAVCAQTSYFVSGTLSSISGNDPLGYNGNTVSATATLTQTMTPLSTTTTSNSSSNTYDGTAAGVQLQGIQCGSTPSSTLTLTDNAGADDTITLTNCSIQFATISATITIPNGNMVTSVPAAIPLTNITGTVSISLGTLGATTYNLTQASILTCTLASDGTCNGAGDPPPTVTPSPTAWTPTVALGSTTPLTQTVTFTTAPSNAVVSFVPTVTTTDGGSWLSVSAPANTSSNLTITVNPAGLTQPTYSGTVTVNYGQGLTSTIPVTLTVSGGTASLTANPPSMSFSYTAGGSPVPSQTLSIGPAGGLSVSAAVTAGNSWLTVSPLSSTTPANFLVSINTSGLTSAGTLSGSIQVTSGNLAPLNVPVTLNVSSSSFALQSTPMTFNYSVGGSQPPAQVATVTGTAGLAFSAAAIVATPTGGNWLVATPSSGSTLPGSVSVSINTTGMTTPGTFTGSVSVSAANGSTGSIPVTLNVTAQATLTAAPSTLNFSYQTGGAAPATQTINVTGTSGVAFTATAAGGAWLSASAGGTTPGSVTVSVNPSNLTANTYNGTVTISAQGINPQVVNVTLVVTSAPTITVAPNSLSFAYQPGGSAPAAQTANVTGTSGLAFTATANTSSGGSWLVANASGTTPGTVSVSLNTSVLTTPGTYNGTVTVAANGVTSQTINVSVVVSTTPRIVASPTSLNFTYQIGGSAPVAQGVSITSGSSLSFTSSVTAGAPWLGVSGSGTTPGSVSVSVSAASLTAGTYNGTVSIAAAASNTPLNIPVTLTVTNGPNNSTFSLSSSSLFFTYTVGGTAPANQTVNITSASPMPVSIGISGSNWLSASLSGTTTPASIQVSAITSGLTPGTYNGTVVVTSTSAPSNPQMIVIQLVVSAPTTLTAAPSSLSFAYVLGGSNPAPQTIKVASSQWAQFSTSVAGANWLSVTSSGANTPASLTATVNPANLPAGTFQAAISITSSGATNSPMTISVTLVISSTPTLAPSPSSLIFNATAGGANPAGQSITLSGSAPTPMQFTVAASPSWLTVSSASSFTPGTIVATVNTAGMKQGSYQGSITIASGTASNSPLTIPVTLNLAVPLTASGPTISTIVSAASYDNSGFAPGTIITIFGSGLGPKNGAVFSVNSQGILDSTLGGVSVTVDGVPAIPLYVQDGQVNAILPFNIGDGGQANVQVTYNNGASAQFNIPLTPSDIQIFTQNARGNGPGSILNADLSVNTASNPAAKGSIVAVYATGAGEVSPNAVTGGVAGDTLSLVSLPYAATINGANASVVYAGTAPSLVYGVDQFNIQLPSNLPSGPVNIVLKVGDSASQPNVTVFIK